MHSRHKPADTGVAVGIAAPADVADIAVPVEVAGDGGAVGIAVQPYAAGFGIAGHADDAVVGMVVAGMGLQAAAVDNATEVAAVFVHTYLVKRERGLIR